MATGPAVSVEPAVTAGGRSRRSSAADPERELLGRERLGEVVVGAEREPADPVGLLPPRGEQDDADVAGLLAPAQLGAARRSPTRPGSIRSRTTMSGRSSRAALSASGPLAAVETR